ASLEILTLADPTVRRTCVRLSRQAWPLAVSFCNNWESSAHERPLWMTSIILSPTFVSSAIRQVSLARSLIFHCGHYVAISKTCYQTIKPASLSSKWSGAGLSVDRFAATADLKMVVGVVEGGRIPAQTTIPEGPGKRTIRFSELRSITKPNGQDFRLIRRALSILCT